MKKILFATTAAGAMAVGGMAAAQGVTVFGDARLGFGYNVIQNGDIIGEDTDAFEEDEVRAISRVRFGVRMTGETDTGITFGATVRADNAGGGAAGTGGNVFASGVFGTITYGDTASAHQQHTGDLPEVGLTGIGFFNEPDYLGNRQGGGNRPTVRYDFDVAGFGISVGTNNDLDEVGVGASFSPQFGGGSLTIGGGYYDGDDNNEWTVAVGGSFAGFNARLIYINRDNEFVDEDDDLIPGGQTESLSLGLGTTVQDIGLNAFYRTAFGGGTDIFDGDDAWGVGFTYNLGGGASLRGGYVNTFAGTDAADFGIQLAF